MIQSIFQAEEEKQSSFESSNFQISHKTQVGLVTLQKSDLKRSKVKIHFDERGHDMHCCIRMKLKYIRSRKNCKGLRQRACSKLLIRRSSGWHKVWRLFIIVMNILSFYFYLKLVTLEEMANADHFVLADHFLSGIFGLDLILNFFVEQES